MGYGNIKSVKLRDDGQIENIDVFDAVRFDSSKKQISASRLAEIESAQKKRFAEDLKKFISKTTRGDFIEID